MAVVWTILSAVKRRKEVRKQGADRYKRKVYCLKNAESKEHLSTQKIHEQTSGARTFWRRRTDG